MARAAPQAQQAPDEDILAVVRALAKRHAREDHAAEIARHEIPDQPRRAAETRS